MKQRKSVCDDLQPAVVDTIVRHKVHLSDHDVRPDSRSCFPANPRGRVLKREPSIHQDPCHGAGCAKAVKRTATPAVASGEEKGKVEATRSVRNCWESNWVKMQVGTTTARGQIAIASAPALRRPSWATYGAKQAAATLCHPHSGMPRSSQLLQSGRSPSARSTHEGNYLSRSSCRLRGVCSRIKWMQSAQLAL